MKKRFLTLLLLPLLMMGCTTNNTSSSSVSEEYDSHTVEHPRHKGEIGTFKLLTPENGYSTDQGLTFTWEEASNADFYQIEIANNSGFSNEYTDDVYVKESNIAKPEFSLNYTLQQKDVLYYWRVTAVNKDHTQRCDEMGNFFYESVKVGEIPIVIEDAQDWALHKEGSYADISIDRSNFFNNGKDSLAIVFDKEHTNQGIPKSDGWIVVTKTEDRELYGTDAFYFNFYYSGHDATVLIRVLDYDGEYWHKQVQISNNSKQTILMKYEDFELRTAGTNIDNRVFDWQHIRYFEIVFEKTFGDGVCLISNIKAVQFENYKNMFVDKVDFRCTDTKDWTYENYDFEKTISEDGSEITLGYEARSATNPNGFNGYGFQNINIYKYLVQGDALRMDIKYTGTGADAIFYFRILEEDNDRWQFKLNFSFLTKNDYKELIIPLKAFQRVDTMNGDGAKQFYFIQKFNVGLADNYSTGSISIKDLEVVKIDDLVTDRKRTVTEDGCIEDFNNYDVYTELYYYWEQSTANKDEAMKLDTIHKVNKRKNTFCAEFDYKADMEQAVYQLYMDASAAVGKTAFSIWLKDATPKSEDPNVSYLNEEDVAAELTIQLTMDSGEWYRYTIDKVLKDWNNYTIAFTDFELVNEASLINDPVPLASEHIIHMALGFQYFYKDQSGNGYPTYAIANPVYLDELYFTNDAVSSIKEMESIKEDADNPNQITVETFETYKEEEDLFDYWSYGSTLDYNLIARSEDVSSQGGEHSLKMHYKGSTSVSYVRATPFKKTITAKGVSLDLKGDGKAIVYLNLNWRVGTTLYKMRCTINNIPTTWTHYEIGFDYFTDAVTYYNKRISSKTAKNIESISFGIVNRYKDTEEAATSDIYVDNIRLIKEIDYLDYTVSSIS